jgi:putative intracellular protease/amidase
MALSEVLLLLLLPALLGGRADALRPRSLLTGGLSGALDAPCFDAAELGAFDLLRGRRALVVTTSHSRLGAEDCAGCKETGVLGEEFTAPLLTFLDAGINVTLASITGGRIPVDPNTFNRFVESRFDRAFFEDDRLSSLLDHAPSVSELDFAQFDMVFMAGGWGAAWDLGTSAALGAGVSKAFAAGKVLGSVCHGALGFILAVKPDGSKLCNGTRMTGVTTLQVYELGIGRVTPMHPEDELKKAGALYECKHGIVDVVQNHLVQDGNIITGQNQMASCQVPQLMLKRLQDNLRVAGGVSEMEV